jgi:hypothetical protein
MFISPFLMDPGNSQRLWTGGRYMWRTTDDATNWAQASDVIEAAESVSAIAAAPANGNFVLAGTDGGHIHRTSIGLTADDKTVWASGQPRTGYVAGLTFHPTDRLTAYATYSTFGGVHVWKTANGGVSWADADGSGATGIPDIPCHSVVVDPADPQRVYVGTDLGVFVSLDGGGTWAVENTGFANVVTEALARDGTNLFAFTHGRGPGGSRPRRRPRSRSATSRCPKATRARRTPFSRSRSRTRPRAWSRSTTRPPTPPRWPGSTTRPGPAR